MKEADDDIWLRLYAAEDNLASQRKPINMFTIINELNEQRPLDLTNEGNRMVIGMFVGTIKRRKIK